MGVAFSLSLSNNVSFWDQSQRGGAGSKTSLRLNISRAISDASMWEGVAKLLSLMKNSSSKIEEVPEGQRSMIVNNLLKNKILSSISIYTLPLYSPLT